MFPPLRAASLRFLFQGRPGGGSAAPCLEIPFLITETSLYMVGEGGPKPLAEKPAAQAFVQESARKFSLVLVWVLLISQMYIK